MFSVLTWLSLVAPRVTRPPKTIEIINGLPLVPSKLKSSPLSCCIFFIYIVLLLLHSLLYVFFTPSDGVHLSPSQSTTMMMDKVNHLSISLGLIDFASSVDRQKLYFQASTTIWTWPQGVTFLHRNEIPFSIW